MAQKAAIGEFFYLPKSRSLLEIVAGKNNRSSKIRAVIDSLPYAKFGKNDKLPNEVMNIAWENHLTPQLIETEINHLHGAGLVLMQKRIVPGTDTRPAKVVIEPAENALAQQIFEELEIAQYWLNACTQAAYSRNVYAQIAINEFRPLELKVFDFIDVRAGLIDEESGEIEYYILFGDNGKSYSTPKYEVFPRYRRGVENQYDRFVMHCRVPIPGQPYYSMPPWWSSLEWKKLSNKIPKFHLSGIDNGYNIKYHVKVPITYLDQFAKEDRDHEWERLQEEFDKQLSGTENVNKAILSKFMIDNMGKPLPGFDIIPLQNISPDGQYIELDKQANLNASSAHGIHPGLAGIDTGGKLGGSAQELRVAHDYYTKVKTPIIRQQMIRPVDLVMKLAGVPSQYFYAPVEIEFTTTDKNPNGNQNVVQNAN